MTRLFSVRFLPVLVLLSSLSAIFFMVKKHYFFIKKKVCMTFKKKTFLCFFVTKMFSPQISDFCFVDDFRKKKKTISSKINFLFETSVSKVIFHFVLLGKKLTCLIKHGSFKDGLVFSHRCCSSDY